MVSRDCRTAASRWLGTEVQHLRVERALCRWADERILGLIKAVSAGVGALTIDCSPRRPSAGSSGSNVAAAVLGRYASAHGARLLLETSSAPTERGFASFDALAPVLACCASLRALTLREATMLTEAHARRIAAQCAHLSSLSLIDCSGLSDWAVGHVVLQLPHLSELNLSRNLQLSAKVLVAIA